MKTSDGRRRITPIFILPNSDSANSLMANPAVNGVNGNSTSSESMAKYHMQSSSSGAKSKIRIEKVDGVVEPNVSPGKKKEGKISSTTTSGPTITSTSSTTSAQALPPAPKANMIAIKHKPGPVNLSNPAIKTVALPVKPTSASSSDQQGSNTNTDSSDSQSAKEKTKKGDVKEKDKAKKKKSNRIESSTDSSDSSESDSSSSSSDDETASQTSGTEKDEKRNEQSKKPGPSAPMPAKSALVTSKRKAEDAPVVVQPPPKKRGRPPGSGNLTPVRAAAPPPSQPATPAAPPAAPPTTLAVPLPTPSSPSRPCPGLPPLTLVNNRQKLHFSQLTVDTVLLNIFVHNDLTNTAYGALHKVTANKTADPNSSVIWDLMLPSPVTSVLSTQHHLLLTCKDATCHLLTRFESEDEGERN